MGSIYHEPKTMLYSDLFKCSRNIVLEKEENFIMSNVNGSSSSSSLSFSHDSSFMGSSSQLGSELGSRENDDGDFMAELARQMAEFMLQEEEKKTISEKSEVYELNNQPSLRKESHVNRGRRVTGTESTHRKTKEHYMQYRGREWGRMRHDGSGMRAIFLDGSKSGTGVFLPPQANDPVKPKKKSGCSTVLIPTRVLQTLDLHFNKLSDSIASPKHSCRKDKSNGLSVSEIGNQDVEMKLPQEWTY